MYSLSSHVENSLLYTDSCNFHLKYHFSSGKSSNVQNTVRNSISHFPMKFLFLNKLRTFNSFNIIGKHSQKCLYSIHTLPQNKIHIPVFTDDGNFYICNKWYQVRVTNVSNRKRKSITDHFVCSLSFPMAVKCITST